MPFVRIIFMCCTSSRRLKKQGIEIHYLAGNHDFALGAFLSEKTLVLRFTRPVSEFDGFRGKPFI